MKKILTPNQEDKLLLKWPVIWLVAALLASTVWYGGAYRFREEKNRALQVARANRMAMLASVRQIEEETGTVRDYCDRYRRLQEERVIGEEDRLELVETVGRIRARHLLYPMQLDIEPRATLPLGQGGGQENPEQGMSIRASRIVMSTPLLHEEDFFRLLEGLNAMQRGIIVAEECVVKRIGSDIDSRRPLLRQNLIASCKLLWLTVNRETAVSGPEAGSMPPDPAGK